jgi:hypothetical protein
MTETLKAANPDELQLVYAHLDELAEKFLQGNPKRHDIGQLWDSMQRYGFRDPLAYDQSLNDGEGGIVEGNGRLETLIWASNNGQKPPRGIKLDKAGAWYVPLILGCDARDMSEAVAYSFDHNTMVLSGGEFTALDAKNLYDPESYVALLEELAKTSNLPLTVDGGDLDLLIEQLQVPNFEPVGEDEQGRLDEIAPKESQEIECTCPQCGHQFIRQV